MSRKRIDELQARIAHLERVNEALLQANEQLKDGAAPPDAKRFIEQRNKARAKLATALEEKDRLARKLRELLDNPSQEITPGLRLQLMATERERDAAKARVLFLESQIGIIKAIQSTSVSSLSRDIWRRLVQLCHPDKHNGSKASTEATRWLMENRPL